MNQGARERWRGRKRGEKSRTVDKSRNRQRHRFDDGYDMHIIISHAYLKMNSNDRDNEHVFALTFRNEHPRGVGGNRWEHEKSTKCEHEFSTSPRNFVSFDFIKNLFNRRPLILQRGNKKYSTIYTVVTHF